MRFAFCCGSGICCALVSAVFWLGGGLVGQAIAQTAPPPSCSSTGAQAASDVALTEAEQEMVPSTFLIDKQGKLTRKLVGFKDKATLDRAFGELVGS